MAWLEGERLAPHQWERLSRWPKNNTKSLKASKWLPKIDISGSSFHYIVIKENLAFLENCTFGCRIPHKTKPKHLDKHATKHFFLWKMVGQCVFGGTELKANLIINKWPLSEFVKYLFFGNNGLEVVLWIISFILAARFVDW